MLAEKKVLSPEVLEEQTAFALPERDMMALIKVVFEDNSFVLVPINVAANLCDINVNVLAAQAESGDTECEAKAEQENEARS